jgi:hypothetical protein
MGTIPAGIFFSFIERFVSQHIERKDTGRGEF